MTNDNNASSFKYKASLTGDTAVDVKIDGVKKAVPLKYLSNFLEIIKNTNFKNNWCKTLYSSCSFINKRQWKLTKTVKWTNLLEQI